MGWFDEQIKQRMKNDDELFTEAFVEMVNLINNKKIATAYLNNKKISEKAIISILRYYRIPVKEIPSNIRDINEILESILRPNGVMRRNIKLSGKWYKDAAGAMLGTKTDGSIIALIPGNFGGYFYQDFETEEIIKINSENEKEIDREAVSFYTSLPLRKLKITDLMKYIFNQLHTKDYILILLITALTTIMGISIPNINRYLFGKVLNYGDGSLLLSAVMSLLTVQISIIFINVIRDILNASIYTKLNLSVESAVMMRVLCLRVDFFKKYSSGEISTRIGYVTNFCSTMFNAIFSVSLTALFSLVYIGQIFKFAPSLVVPAILITLITAIFSIISSLVQMRITEKQMEESSKEYGLVYALINGISKIKNSGAEKRAFAKWSKQYTKSAKYIYKIPIFLKLRGTINTAISLVGMSLMYFMAIKYRINMEDYMAFNSAYSMVSGAFISLAGIVVTVSRLKPVLKMIKPILDADVEIESNRHIVTKLKGSIEINNLSFKYSENMPNVIDNMSLKIPSGQYIAVVGKTGCGKSTLIRIMLGFEKAQKGSVYYDGRDISTIDLKSLRKKIGVVMQNGKLFRGDIFSNITISAPEATLNDAWEAAEMAGIADDIKNMPMGMHTIISEGQGDISGGQRQRLMIARAIVSRPKILMFDEATSALDNITQKKVSDSLERLKCTRIAIAHRLSTIKHCDRIIVLDKGKIVEDGTYEELINKKGYFSQLVDRQRLDL